jgi:hypothetical protein
MCLIVEDNHQTGDGSAHMSTYQDDEIVMVPVPRSLLMRVYAAMGNAATEQGALAQAEETVEVPGQGPWTATRIRRLESVLDSSALRALITRLAEQAPEELTFKEAVQAAGIDSNLLRAQLGSLSKISKRLFEKIIWPMEVRYAEGGDAIYSMDQKIAEWWLEAIGRGP